MEDNFTLFAGDVEDILNGNSNFIVYSSNPLDFFINQLKAVIQLLGFDTMKDKVVFDRFAKTIDNITENLDYLEEFFVNTSTSSDTYLKLKNESISGYFNEFDSSLVVLGETKDNFYVLGRECALTLMKSDLLFLFLLNILGVLKNGLNMGVDLNIDKDILKEDIDMLQLAVRHIV